VLIDKRRKLPVTVMLRAVGFSTNQDLREHFYAKETIDINESLGKYIFGDVIDNETGEILFPATTQIDDAILSTLSNSDLTKIEVIAESSATTFKLIENTIAKDQTTNREEALKKIYNLIRPGEEPTLEVAEDLFERMFFNERRYNLAEVGRYKINNRLDLDIPLNKHILTKEDLVAIVEKLILVYKGNEAIDDIDHLANRRLRTIGELLHEQYNIGLARVARTAIERMAIANSDEITIHDLINSNALIAVVQSFFSNWTIIAIYGTNKSIDRNYT
jgi:DNA-directed RNA polymerase subunit beta